jgi:hypothetical protein
MTIEPTPNAAKISDTPPGDIPRFAVEYGPKVVIQPPYAALNPRLQSPRTTSGRSRTQRPAVPAAGVAAADASTAAATAGTSSVASGSGGGVSVADPAAPRATAGSAGRNRIAAMAARVAVTPTTMNGTRRLIARTAPIVGPRTEPLEPAAETIPFVKASFARSATRAMYSRSAMIERPPPSPASARNAMSGTAAVAVAMRKLAAA